MALLRADKHFSEWQEKNDAQAAKRLIRRLKKEAEEAARDLCRCREPVGWLRCFRGIDTVTVSEVSSRP